MYYDYFKDTYSLSPNVYSQTGVSFVRRELLFYLKQYSLIDDCIAGEQRIKDRKTEYLTLPGKVEDAEWITRYNNYLNRAVFYGVAGRTLESFVGKVFTRDAVIDVPPVLQPVIDNASGDGVSLEQLSQKAVAVVMAKGRAGVHIDFPSTADGVSRADLSSGAISPLLFIYHPQHIINWRVERLSSKEKLTLVVLQEYYTIEEDDFASRQAVQYRVLRLRDNVYTTELWRDQGGNKGFSLFQGPIVPLNSAGMSYDEIPFRFIGPRESAAMIEKPPMYDLCSINIGHYRNSADYEESCFVTGQPTVWAAGLTQQWVSEVLNGQVNLGSRGILPLPEGGNAGLLQTTPNTMPFEAMQHKERQMIALGAKLIEQKSVQRTATEADMDEEAESSVLSSVARNVSKAMQWALQWAGYFVGVPESQIKYELNTDFDLADLSPEERGQLLREWQAEAITRREYRDALRKAGVATLTDEDALAEITLDRVAFTPELDEPDPNEPPGGIDA